MQYFCPRPYHFGTVTLDLHFDDPGYPHCPQCGEPMAKSPPAIEPSRVASVPMKSKSTKKEA